MTAFRLIINKLKSHLSFVIFAMYPYSKKFATYKASNLLGIATIGKI